MASEGTRELVFGLSYYHPYVSGLSNAAKVVAEQLVLRGWQVSVVTSQHDSALDREEVIGGVRVIRVPVLARISKGVVAPTLPAACAREIRRAGRGNLHLPMLEAGAVASLVGRSADLSLTYQCDVVLPRGLLNTAATRAMDASSRLAVARSRGVIVSSIDYMSQSRLARQIQPKAYAISPPSLVRPAGAARFRRGAGPHVGFLGRIVEEKGIPYLVEAFRAVAAPDWQLLIAGEFEGIAGGSRIEAVRAAARDDSRIHILGFVPEQQMPDFYASIDVFAFPSVNPLEAFGIAQVEAMFAGVPVVASGLPGVRQPIMRTGMGELVEPRDPVALGQALTRVLTTPKAHWAAGRARALEEYSMERIIDRWEGFLERGPGS